MCKIIENVSPTQRESGEMSPPCLCGDDAPLGHECQSSFQVRTHHAAPATFTSPDRAQVLRGEQREQQHTSHHPIPPILLPLSWHPSEPQKASHKEPNPKPTGPYKQQRKIPTTSHLHHTTSFINHSTPGQAVHLSSSQAPGPPQSLRERHSNPQSPADPHNSLADELHHTPYPSQLHITEYSRREMGVRRASTHPTKQTQARAQGRAPETRRTVANLRKEGREERGRLRAGAIAGMSPSFPLSAFRGVAPDCGFRGCGCVLQPIRC